MFLTLFELILHDGRVGKPSIKPTQFEDFQINTRVDRTAFVFCIQAMSEARGQTRLVTGWGEAGCQMKLWHRDILSAKLSNVILRGILTSFVISSENQKTSHPHTVKMNRQEVSSEVWKLLSKNILSPGCQETENNKTYFDTRRSRGARHVAQSAPTNCWGNFMLITGLLPHISLAKHYIYLQNVPYTYFRNTFEANI